MSLEILELLLNVIQVAMEDGFKFASF